MICSSKLGVKYYYAKWLNYILDCTAYWLSKMCSLYGGIPKL